MSIAELSVALGVHRSIAYRILRTLEDHGLIVRNQLGTVTLGPRMATLARGVNRDLQTAALPELTTVANELMMTAFLVVLDQNECVTLVSVEPRHNVATVVQRPGTRHLLSVGAPGIAIQSRLLPTQLVALLGDQSMRLEVEDARFQGFATSHDEVIAGLSSVAAAFPVPHSTPAAVAVVYIKSKYTLVEIGNCLMRAAEAIANELT